MQVRFYFQWCIILVLITFISPVSAVTAPMAISANQKYFNTGVYSVNTISTFNNASAANWNPLLYTVTYPATYGTISSVLVFIALKNLHVQYSSGRISFYGMKSSITLTSFVFKLYSNFTSSIQLLDYSYLIAKNEYNDVYNMNCATVIKNISSNISSASPFSSSIFLSDPFNITGIIDGVASFVGFDYVVTNSNNILDLQIQIYFNTSNLITDTISSKGTTPIFVNTIHYNWIVYNKGFYNKPNFASFTSGILSGTAGTGTSSLHYLNSSNLYSASTMMGIWYIKIQGDNYIDFKININSPDYLGLTSTNAANTFYLTYIMFFTYYCSYATPYYYLTNTTCYDSCPDRTYQDGNSLSCINCPFDCYTCGYNGGCLSCNDSDHRVLNTSTNRCVPAPGYYESGITVAASCPTSCSVCSSSTSCIICYLGYTLNTNNLCLFNNSVSASVSSNTNATDKGDQTPIGAIVGGIVAGLVGVIIIIGIVYCVRKRRPKKNPINKEEMKLSPKNIPFSKEEMKPSPKEIPAWSIMKQDSIVPIKEVTIQKTDLQNQQISGSSNNQNYQRARLQSSEIIP